MTEYQVTFWRELPSMVVARDGEATTRTLLAPRFQNAIDEAAMRLGDTGSEDYLAGWRRGDWTPTDADAAQVLEQVIGELEEAWPTDRVKRFLDALSPEGSA